MKRIFTMLVPMAIGIILTVSVFLPQQVNAQSPEKMSYQAVIRDADDNLVTSQAVGIQISIVHNSVDGTVVFVERHFPSTNINGLVTLEIGTGTIVSGNFATIDWSDGPFFIKTETDFDGGANYTISGTNQLLSVPYALHAKTAETVTGDVTETDPVYGASVASGILDADTINWNNKLDRETDPEFTESEAAKITAGDITNLSNLTGTNTGDQDLSGFLTSETDPSVPSGTQVGEMQYWDGFAWIIVQPGSSGQVLTFSNGVPGWSNTVGWNDVHNPSTGETWMDRNLGASRAALSSADVAAYGDLYQWGRGADLHEKRTSNTTSTLSSSDTPGHGNFITYNSTPYDWRSPQNDNLWQGVSGANNPCPSGYRLPTEAEWEAERTSWSSNNADGAFASPLKLTISGRRNGDNGSFSGVGSGGYYWSSTVDGTLSRRLLFYSSNAEMGSNIRALGYSVRCIKD